STWSSSSPSSSRSSSPRRCSAARCTSSATACSPASPVWCDARAMEALGLYGPLSDTALLLGLSVTRVAVAFLLVPLFTAELVPAMVRNSIFLSIALLSLVLQPSAAPLVLSGWQWLSMFAKEAFIGGAGRAVVGRVVWGLRAAGQPA